ISKVTVVWPVLTSVHVTVNSAPGATLAGPFPVQPEIASELAVEFIRATDEVRGAGVGVATLVGDGVDAVVGAGTTTVGAMVCMAVGSIVGTDVGSAVGAGSWGWTGAGSTVGAGVGGSTTGSGVSICASVATGVGTSSAAKGATWSDERMIEAQSVMAKMTARVQCVNVEVPSVLLSRVPGFIALAP